MVLIRECIATKATQSEYVMFMYIHVHGHTYCTSIRDHFTAFNLDMVLEGAKLMIVETWGGGGGAHLAGHKTDC